jgi:hypothetical protein
MEQLAPFHGWEASESDHPTVKTIPDKVANEKLSPQNRMERSRRLIKAPTRLIEETE